MSPTINAMKTIFAVLFILCAVTAFGQTAAVLSNQAQMMVMPDHPVHAGPHAMAPEQSLVGGSAYSYAQGEMPLWELGPFTQPVALGDVAREYRKEKAAQPRKKAVIVFEKQGR